MKGVAVACAQCEDEIACVFTFRETRSEITITVVKSRRVVADDGDVLSVAKATDYRVLAGAIAKRARAQERCLLRAIGRAAVFTAVRAIGTAREYLEQERLDVLCVPAFNKVHVNGRQEDTTVIDLKLVPCSLAGDNNNNNNDNNNVVSCSSEASSSARASLEVMTSPPSDTKKMNTTAA